MLFPVFHTLSRVPCYFPCSMLFPDPKLLTVVLALTMRPSWRCGSAVEALEEGEGGSGEEAYAKEEGGGSVEEA